MSLYLFGAFQQEKRALGIICSLSSHPGHCSPRRLRRTFRRRRAAPARWYDRSLTSFTNQEKKPMTSTRRNLILALLVLTALVPVASIHRAEAAPDAPAVGVAAPDFSLTTNEGKPASLKDFRGKWVVLYFYPKDFTGGCTLEAQNFQRDVTKYKAKGAVVLGVSVDSVSSHKDFC